MIQELDWNGNGLSQNYILKLFLRSCQAKLKTGVRLLFQPAEEIASGARWMIKDGAANGLTHILGVHVYPDLSVGTIGIKEGSLTAAAGELKVEIKENLAMVLDLMKVLMLSGQPLKLLREFKNQ